MMNSSPVSPISTGNVGLLTQQQVLNEQKIIGNSAITEEEKSTDDRVDPQLSVRFHTRSQTLSRKINDASLRARTNNGSMKSPSSNNINNNNNSNNGQTIGEVRDVINVEAAVEDLRRSGDSDVMETDVHVVKLAEIFDRFYSSSTDGLINEQVDNSRIKWGNNTITPTKQKSYILLFLEQLISGFGFILWLAALVFFLSWKPLGYLDGGTPQIVNVCVAVFLIIVIIVSAIFNFYQEVRSMALLKAFSHIIPRHARVIRGGSEQIISADELVCGDIVKIGLGDKIPADLRLLSVNDLQVNNSALTGESEPVTLGLKTSSLNYLESTNLAFYSALVVSGTGVGIVVATGDETVLGQVSQLTQANNSNDTSLHQEIRRFVLIITCIAFFTGALTFIMWGSWLYRAYPKFMPPAYIVINAFSLIVAYVPEGLPVCVTVTLTLIAKRMYKQRVIVKNLAIIETFNSVSIICSDKTGTLTQNVMTVVEMLWGRNGEWKVPAVNANDDKNLNEKLIWNNLPHHENNSFIDLIEGAINCNNAEQQIKGATINNNDDKKDQSVIGDAVDVALYKLSRDKLLINIESKRILTPRIKVLPFNSKNKLMITMNEKQNDEAICFLKGAPEIIMQYCSHIMMESATQQNLMERVEINDEYKLMIQKRQELLGQQGYRVIGLAKRDLSSNEWKTNLNADKLGPTEFNHLPNNSYTLIGLFALIDPPRVDCAASVEKSRKAGIRVAVVTGDHQTTATAIAKQVNIISEENYDTIKAMKLGEDEIHRPIMQIYEGQNLIESHIIGTNPEHSTITIPNKMNKMIVEQKSQKNKNNNNFKNKVSFYDKFTLLWSEWFGVSNVGDNEKRVAPIKGAIVLTGSDIKLFDDYLWSYTLQHSELIFARTSPEQKLRIVSELQARHEIVAVTGDGVNDAPALKVSNIGAAMSSGAEVAHEAGDLILLNNDFTSIVRAIETGRLASDNLKKVCLYLLPGSTWSEMWPVMFNVFLGVPLSLSSFEMIILSVCTDVCDALALVQEKPEMALMERAPIDRRFSHLVDWRLLFHAYVELGTICSFTAWFNYIQYFKSQGIPVNKIFLAFTWLGESCCLDQNDSECVTNDSGNCYRVDDRIYSSDEQNEINFTGQSIFFISILIVNFFNMLATRTRYQSFFQQNPFFGRKRNLWLFAAIVAASLIGVFITQVPWFNDVFFTRPVPVKDVAPAIGFGAFLFLFDEVRKWNLRNRPNSLWAKMAW